MANGKTREGIVYKTSNNSKYIQMYNIYNTRIQTLAQVHTRQQHRQHKQHKAVQYTFNTIPIHINTYIL